MARIGKITFSRRKDGKCYFYLSKRVAEDKGFPFEQSDFLVVEIKEDLLVIRKA